MLTMSTITKYNMKLIEYDKRKDEALIKERGVSFEEVIKIIKIGGLIGIAEHHNKSRYPSQKIYIIKMKEYIYIVPFVENDNKIFLKTIIPSRKYKKKYLI